MTQVVTRFAPSPTGFLHIGSARTALFNWLFARHYGGKFFLRIEDTDRVRSTQAAINAIFESMKWLELDWDGDIVFQFARANRHAEVANQLVNEGKAYFCYCTPHELELMREEAKSKGLPPTYDGRWRDRDHKDVPKDIKPVIRFKAPQEGETKIQDCVQGDVHLQNKQLDDMILLRADGTPTYMLSVVVDDHDMGITHIIRGDDHLTNAFRQYHLYKACGWDVPSFSHIPLIHGPDGAKLSKRHGALGAEAYKEMGFLPEAMRNYLLRLGWSHKDDEIIPTHKAIEWFNLESIGRSPARFDVQKLTALNAHYIKEKSDTDLTKLIHEIWEHQGVAFDESKLCLVEKGMPGLKTRAKTLVELADSALFYVKAPEFNKEDLKSVSFKLSEGQINELGDFVLGLSDFSHDALQMALKTYSEEKNIKLGDIAQVLRLALTGKSISPSLFEVMDVFGKNETVLRMKHFLNVYRLTLVKI